MALDQIGIEAILKDEAFQAGVKRYQQGIDDMMRGTKKGGDTIAEDFAVVGLAIKGIEEVVNKVVGTFEKIFEFGEEGARINQINQSFVTLIGSGEKAAEMERELSEAVHGTMDDEDMQSAILQMLAGSTGVFADRVKESAAQIFQMAAAGAKLNPTMGDTATVLQSVAMSLETGNLRGLKRLGIIVSAADSEAIYAKSIGKTAKELDEEEVKVAHLNAALEYLPKLMAQVGGTTESAIDPFNRMKTALEDTSEIAKMEFAPTIAAAADAIALLLTWQKKLDDAMAEHNSQTFKTTAAYEDYITEMQRAYKAAGIEIDATGKQTKSFYNQAIGQTMVIESQIAMTRETYELTKATEEGTTSTDESVRALARQGDTFDQSIALQKKATDAAQKLADAQVKVADAWLASVMKIKTGNDKYLADRAELAAKGDAESKAKIALLDQEAEKARDAQAAEMLKPEMFANVEAYTEAKRKLILATGLGTAAAFAEQDAQNLLATAYGAGRITAEQYELGLRKIPEAARDGMVSIGELVSSLSGTKFSLKNLDDSTAAVKSKMQITYLEAGREAPIGAAQGVAESAPVFASAISAMAEAGIFAFQDKLLMRSPSLVFAALGSELMAGLAQGIAGGNELVQAALQDISAATILPLTTALENFNLTMGGAGGTLSDLEQLKGLAASSGGTIADPLEAAFYRLRDAAAEAGSAVGGVAGGLAEIKAIGNITTIITTIHIDIYKTKEGGTEGPAKGGETGGSVGGGGGGTKGRATGGPVSAGVPVPVGEKGPEIFVPDTAGNIIPHYGSMVNTTNNFNLYVTSAAPVSTVVQDFRTMQTLAGVQ